MPTKSDIITHALRRIGVVSAEEVADADQFAYCADVLDDAFAEIKNVQGFTWTWGLDATPSGYLEPMAELLASRIASHFGLQGPSEARAIGRLRALSFANDISDRADTNDDGVVSDGEAAADARAVYY